MERVIETIPTETMDILVNWTWPGEVRELENFIERSVILTEGSALHAPLTELKVGSHGSLESSLEKTSSGTLARLLLSCAPRGIVESDEQRLRSAMTHEKMARRIGSSRAMVTRLLSNLKKKRLKERPL
jgi:DNA-binding NtrC family response regulator